MNKTFVVTLIATAFFSSLAIAQEPVSNADLAKELAALKAQLKTSQESVDSSWIVTAAALVFLMQAGFCLLELGFSRAKNCINIVMKNVLDFSVASLGYVLFGFGLMYGASVMGVLGSTDFFMLSGDADSSVWAFLMFQLVFVGTAATITSGAVAERTKFIGYVVYSFIVSILIYPIVGHWVWGGNWGDHGTLGWLNALGFHDFAGGTVVHVTGGACALAGIIVLGPRLGRFKEDGSSRIIVGHNIPMAALGTFILWFAWFGFNAGSAMHTGAELGRIALNTNLAAAVGALTAMASMWYMHGRPDPAITLNGALGGLVAVTAGCDIISPGYALVIGAIAGIIATYGVALLEGLKLDDVVGAVPVHLFNGIWGTVAVGLYNDQTGFGSPSAIGIQVAGSFAVALASFVGAFIAFKVIDATVGLRASDVEQEEGLDFHEHSTSAYPDFQTTDNQL